MTTIPQNQRLNFADFLNGELGVKKTVNTPRTKNQESKEKNIERLIKHLESSKDFLREICRWKQDPYLNLGVKLFNEIQSTNLSYEEKFKKIAWQIENNIKQIFLSPALNGSDEIFDQEKIKGGFLNALQTQLGLSLVTINKLQTQSNEQIRRTLKNNLKTINQLMQLQFMAFKFLLDQMTKKNGRNLFHEFQEEQMEFLYLKNGQQILVPTTACLQKVIQKAKNEAIEFKDVEKTFRLHDSGMAVGCLAQRVRVKQYGNKSTKANLASEFADYLNKVITTTVA